MSNYTVVRESIKYQLEVWKFCKDLTFHWLLHNYVQYVVIGPDEKT